jgi:hypothetical protein
MCGGYLMVICEVVKWLVVILYQRGNLSPTISVRAVTEYLSCLVWELTYF